MSRVIAGPESHEAAGRHYTRPAALCIRSQISAKARDERGGIAPPVGP